MRLTPKTLRNAARLSLAGAIVVSCLLLFSPGPGVDHLVGRLLPWDKAAHFIGFYGLTALTMLSFPSRRRADLTVILMLCGISSEIIQGFVGRDCEFGDFIADTVGVLAVTGPMAIARLRTLVQTEPHVSFAVIRRRDRRRSAHQRAKHGAHASRSAPSVV